MVLPALVACTTAVELSARPEAAPFDGFGRGLTNGVLLALVAIGVSLLHGARVGFCDALDGLAQLALGPGFGAVLAGAWGAAVGLALTGVERRRRRPEGAKRPKSEAMKRGGGTEPRPRIVLALVLGFAGPLATGLFSLWRFVSSPMVFAFDPFFGHFSGPLYDTVIEPVERLESYRLGTLLSLLAAAALFFHLERRSGELCLVGRGRPGVALAGALAALASFGLALSGPELGHWSTTASIRDELERSLVTERCEIVYATSIPLREAELLGRECDAHVRELEAWFEARGPEKITVFVFESEAQKGRLMGAQNTYIAKPWRKEVYVQFARYPHPVLGHELAHVVSGSFGQGPFRVAGPLGGWLPDPGRIEGVATASTPSDDPEFTLQEWSRAMLELGLLPRLGSVFRLSFLGQNSSTAYTVAGAFVEWLRETHGAAAVRRWYGGEPLPAVAGGKDLEALEADWRASLAKLTLPEQALEMARARFDRPAIFGRKCPHVVDRLIGEAHARLNQGDYRSAEQKLGEALELDPESFPARLALGSCAERAGDEAEARRRWAELSRDPKLHKLLRLAAVEAMADQDLARGRLTEARAGYREIADNVLDEDRLRTLDVKSNPGSELGRQAIVSLLVGDPRYGRDFGEAAAALGRWAATEPDNGVPEYLLGRNFYLGGRYPVASARLDAALGRRIELGRVEAEALRVRLVVACAERDLGRAREALERWRKLPVEPGARAAVERVARRCGL